MHELQQLVLELLRRLNDIEAQFTRLTPEELTTGICHLTEEQQAAVQEYVARVQAVLSQTETLPGEALAWVSAVINSIVAENESE